MEKEYTLEFSFLQDDLIATMRIVPRSVEISSISPSDLFEAIRNEGITHGVFPEVIHQVAQEKTLNRWVTIAKGEKPGEGKDGGVRFHFSTEGAKARLKEDLSGRVNIRDMNLIQNVKKGDVLCELIPPETGTNGTSVKGEEILGKIGAPAKLPSGKNIEVSEDGTRLLSSIDGMVAISDSTISVEPVYVVDKVDSSVGNIRFNGSVVINGEVGDGYEIHAGEDITIAMSVGRVVLNALGSIKIFGGILGQEKADISARDSIHVKFIQDAQVEAGGPIVVEDYIRNSQVTSAGPVIVKSPSGWIAGSTVSSHGWIYCHTIGHEAAMSDTTLSIGHNPALYQERERLQQEILDKIDTFLKFQSSLAKLRALKEQNRLSAQQEDLFRKILSAVETLRHSLGLCDEQIRNITERISTVFSGTICIEGIVNQGTRILVGKEVREIVNTKVRTQFTLHNSDISESEFVMTPEIKAYLSGA
ncbi:MAG TPA: DUF342 domain-containing protein [Deltaproteobacteria bacterium]|nr:DUF342 domain-containing protein [Deltaproteobacteria bacterium]